MSDATDFATTLAVGKVAESRIARFLIGRGWSVLPVYEIEMDRGKGPQLYTPTRDYVAPDMLVFRSKDIHWVEAKHKSVFTWYYKRGRWTTGIDRRHYDDYLAIDEQTPWGVWLIFLHQRCVPDRRDMERDCPAISPTGLFGNTLKYLRDHVDHESPPFDSQRPGCTGWGRSGMVYWHVGDLKLIAKLSDVPAAS